MKRYTSFFLFIVVTMLMIQSSSCTKQLEQVQPQDAISKKQVLNDPNAALTLYTGMYGLLRTYNSTLFQLGELRSDIWVNGLFTESAEPTAQQLGTQNISALNAPFNNWGGFYNLIYNLNNIITLFPQTGLSQSDKDRMMAEAYGLRAYVYYTLVKNMG